MPNPVASNFATVTAPSPRIAVTYTPTLGSTAIPLTSVWSWSVHRIDLPSAESLVTEE